MQCFFLKGREKENSAACKTCSVLKVFPEICFASLWYLIPSCHLFLGRKWVNFFLSLLKLQLSWYFLLNHCTSIHPVASSCSHWPQRYKNDGMPLVTSWHSSVLTYFESQHLMQVLSWSLCIMTHVLLLANFPRCKCLSISSCFLSSNPSSLPPWLQN